MLKGGIFVKKVKDNKSSKKTVSLRLEESTDDVLNQVKNKYGISKSKVVETLINKYVKEEYGSI